MIPADESPSPRSGGPSAPPTPAVGTRARGGNAMARTRVAVLAGALRAVERSGTRRTTMAEVAALGGVAKATVYNHFRAKGDVLAALVESEVRSVGEECLRRAGEAAGRDGLGEALEHAALRLSEHRALRRLAEDEPEVLARLLVPDGGPAWTAARQAAEQVLRSTGRQADEGEVDTVLRVVASHLPWPAGRASAGAVAEAVARGLPPAAAAGVAGAAEDGEDGPAEEVAGTPQRDTASADVTGTGTGWPG